MRSPKAIAWDRLMHLLEEEDPTRSPEQFRADLQAQGIDPDAFIEATMQLVAELNAAARADLRRLASAASQPLAPRSEVSP